MNKQEQEIRENLIKIKELAKKCNRKEFHATVTQVSRSGMSRHIHFVAITKKGEAFFPTYWIAKVLGLSYRNSDDSLFISGCGMDMIFETLYRVNHMAKSYGVARVSKNKSTHDIYYSGIVNTRYRSI